MNYIKTILIGLMVVTAMSCSKDEDRTSPVADITTPANGAHFYRGENIFLNAIFTDDESGLKECSIGLVSLKALKGWDDPWMPEVETIALSGLEKEVSDHIIFNAAIPMDIMSGSYVLNFKVVDAEGNLSQYSKEIYVE